MILARLAIFLVLTFFIAPAGLIAQETIVNLAFEDERELRRTAIKLKIWPQRVQELRVLLDRATDLALAMETGSERHFAKLASLWLQLNRSRAEEPMEVFLDRLRLIAESTDDPLLYLQATTGANEIQRLLPDRSLPLEDWPGPPVGVSGKLVCDMDQLLKFKLNMALKEDPLKAFQLLAEEGEEFNDNYFRDRLINRLLSHGAHEEATRLLDQTLLRIVQQTQENDAYIAARLVGTTSWYIHERLPEALEAWYTLMTNFPPDGSSHTVKIDGELFSLTHAEKETLNTIQQLLTTHPNLALEVITWFPDLNSKLETIGGLDGYTSGSRKARRRTPRQMARADIDRDSFREFLDNYDDPETHASTLIQYSSRYYHDLEADAALGRESLDAALRATRHIEEAGDFANMVQSLAYSYERLEGEFPDELIELFHLAMARLSSEPEPDCGCASIRTGVFNKFVSRWLIVDMPAALNFLSSLGNDSVELEVLLSALKI